MRDKSRQLQSQIDHKSSLEMCKEANTPRAKTANMNIKPSSTMCNSALSSIPPLPTSSLDMTKPFNVNDVSKSPFKRQICSVAKLKSPERRILYKEWFTIIKKMEKDPKFDLEALVRTRGRFTEHDRISYRDKLLLKQQRLRCARSEPNFSAMHLLSASMGSGASGEAGDTVSLRMTKSRGGISTAPAAKGRTKMIDEKSTQQKIRRNFSANMHDINNDSRAANNVTMNGSNNNNSSNNNNNTMKSESFSETIRRNWELDRLDNSSRLINRNLEEPNNLASALKLTLQKSDINFIKEILKKKDKSTMSAISDLAFNSFVRSKSPSSAKDANSSRILNI
jgi:hypothetical protein